MSSASTVSPNSSSVRFKDDSRDVDKTSLDRSSSGASSRSTISFAEHEENDTYYVANGKIFSDNAVSSQLNVEHLAERLFSDDHLKVILQSPPSFAHFRAFLALYRPHLAGTLRQYLDVQKALAAVKYANALAENLWPDLEAATIKEDFEARLRVAHEKLLSDALPGYITYKATELVTEVLAREITGQGIPVLKDMVNGLAEVYCLTDPRQKDNPIIYASDEFYQTTQYTPEAVIGKNCRFLQGSVTSRASVSRIIEALSDGKELCETLLNYRRDGSPFLNLLLIAPLYDSGNTVRYFLGAQIDVNGLFERGRGLQSFAQLLEADRVDAAQRNSKTPKSIDAIGQLGRLLNDNERLAVNYGDGSRGTYSSRRDRNRIDTSDVSLNGSIWMEQHLGPNGRLPGVFQNYILVSPAPALKIIFASPSLHSTSLINSPLMSRVRGPSKLRQSVESALSNGNNFTAKISWLSDISAAAGACRTNSKRSSTSAVVPDEAQAGRQNGDGQQVNPRINMRRANTEIPKYTWIHCTPLLDGNHRVGVWMIVMVKDPSDTFGEGLAFRGK